jgi:hypothetical protein
VGKSVIDPCGARIVGIGELDAGRQGCRDDVTVTVQPAPGAPVDTLGQGLRDATTLAAPSTTTKTRYTARSRPAPNTSAPGSGTGRHCGNADPEATPSTTASDHPGMWNLKNNTQLRANS